MNIASLEVAELLGSHRDALPYSERAYGPAWMTWELISTPPARAHLVDWLATASPPPWEPLDLDSVKVGLRDTYIGDLFVVVVLGKVLAKVPRPVAEYALANVTWLGLGCELMGSCGAVTDFGDRPWYIKISAPRPVDRGFPPEAGVAYIAAHEVAHAWTMPAPGPGVFCMPRADQYLVHSAPTAEIEQINAAALPEVQRRRRQYVKHEEVATKLALQWGFEGEQGE